MPRFLIVHPPGQRRDDILLEDNPLTVDFAGGWAIFRDGDGICTAIPAAMGARIERVDDEKDPEHEEPAPQKE